MNIKIGTYNIFGMPWGSKDLRAILLWVFLKSGVEIMCLQEVWSRKQQEMIEEMCHDSKQWSCHFPYPNNHKLGQWTQRFYSGSGLCILVRNTIELLDEPESHAYILMKGVDSFVRKGFMILRCKKEEKEFQVVNTHFQSDMTEIPYWRLRYNDIRLKQEKQLYQTVRYLSCPIVLGDFNTEEFMYFECLEKHHKWTFRGTNERLDSCLRSYHHRKAFQKITSEYAYTIDYSDHIPVLFTLSIL